MSIKTFAIAATLAAATATTASANAFSFGETLEDAAVVELGLVTADAAGVVEIYNYAGGKQGALLGSEDVHAGANQNVRVDIGSQYLNDVIAVLRIDGDVVATKDYDIDR